MPNIKLILGYDGTAYHGFQIQANALTIQEVLEEAICRIIGTRTRVIASGRTDTGVHATGQVVNFFADTRIPVDRLPHALNSVLPEDIVVYEAGVVPDNFHARFDAKSKIYTYTIDNAPHRRVLERRYTCHERFPLDVDLMRRAAAQLAGTHDFASFCAAGSPVKTTVRNLMRLELTEKDRFITITAEADGFLYNMVRIISGTLIEVGRGRRHPDMTEILAARDRNVAGFTAPPHALVLREVKY